MATTRFSLIQWDDDTAAVDRTQFNDAFASIDNLGAGYTQTTGAPGAASAAKVGFIHFNTTDNTLFYCDGSTWQQINLFANTTDSTISAITPGDSKSAGSSTDVAKADHVHEMPAFGSISNLAASATSTDGSATTFAKSDHVHGIPNSTITNAMLAGSITGSKLSNGTVTTTQIASNTITGSNINSSTTITAATYLVGGDDGLTAVTGDYGSVQTTGSGAGSYEGYSIGGHAVFMALDSTGDYGLYDDTNSDWALKATRNGATELYYDGSSKLATNSGGVTVTGTVTGNLTGTASLATSVTVTANNTNNETVYLTFVDGATGTQGLETDNLLTYNPSSNTLGSASTLYTGSSISVSGGLGAGGSVSTGNGSVSAPSHSFSGDTDTGMYRSAADQLSFATNSSEKLRITSAGDLRPQAEGIVLDATGKTYWSLNPPEAAGNDSEWVSYLGYYYMARNSSVAAGKENITSDLGTHLTADMIDSVVPKMWNRITAPGIPEIGPIADEMDEVSSFLAAHGTDANGDQILTGINKTAWISLLTIALQDARARIAALEEG